MAEPSERDSSSLNWEKDWPDPDVDSSTEEGAEITRRNEASLVASIDRNAQNQREATQAAHDDIPASLYDKARDHQDELTEAERQLLLSRGDVIGKALAYPDSLTTEEIHEACGWPPPDVVRANIQRATDGRLSTPVELYAKVKDALENGQFKTVITDDEACLIAHAFYSRDDYSLSRCMAIYAIPGFGYALSLVSRRLGLDIAVFKACGERSLEVEYTSSDSPEPPATTSEAPQGQPNQGQSPRELLDALTSTQEQYRLGNLSEEDFLARTRSILDAMKASNPNRRPFRLPPQPTHPALLPPGVPQPSWSDINGAGPFPVNGGSVGAFQLFADDEGHPVHKYQAAAAWAALSEDEKGVYRARAEAIRREAWAEYETRLACKDAGLPQPPYPKPAGPPPPHIQAALDRHPGMGWPNPNPVLPLSGFEVFRNDLVAEDPGLSFRDVLARWEALTDQQRAPYEVRAWEANKAVRPPRPLRSAR